MFLKIHNELKSNRLRRCHALSPNTIFHVFTLLDPFLLSPLCTYRANVTFVTIVSERKKEILDTNFSGINLGTIIQIVFVML